MVLDGKMWMEDDECRNVCDKKCFSLFPWYFMEGIFVILLENIT